MWPSSVDEVFARHLCHMHIPAKSHYLFNTVLLVLWVSSELFLHLLQQYNIYPDSKLSLELNNPLLNLNSGHSPESEAH